MATLLWNRLPHFEPHARPHPTPHATLQHQMRPALCTQALTYLVPVSSFHLSLSLALYFSLILLYHGYNTRLLYVFKSFAPVPRIS